MARELTCLLRGVSGAEGPCVDRAGRLFMVGPSEGSVLEVVPGQGGAAAAARDLVKYDGIPAGLQLDPNDDLWIADMKRGILRVTHAGELHHEVAEFEGRPIRGCNDCAFDRRGNLYATAPAGSDAEHPVGEVYCRLAGGEVRRLDAGYQFCNGIAVSADDRTLIVAETFTKKLWAFDLPEPGVARNKRHWGTLPGSAAGGPDGIDFDEAGYLLAAHWGGGAVEVFDPAGRHVGRIETPFVKVSNVHFRGPGSRELLITEHDTHGLWLTTWDRAGQRQYGWK